MTFIAAKNAQDSRQLADDFAVMQPLGLSGTGAEHVHTGQNSWYRTIPTSAVWQQLSALLFLTALLRVLCLPAQTSGRAS